MNDLRAVEHRFRRFLNHAPPDPQRIPFHVIDPSALAEAEDLYESMVGEVDSLAFGAAFSLYFEAVEA